MGWFLSLLFTMISSQSVKYEAGMEIAFVSLAPP